MTSLQHHSHLLNHHSASTVAANNNTGNSLNMSLNNSANNLSPVIQRKIDTQSTNHSNTGTGFNRYSSGSAGAGLLNQGPDFDTTSIASVSESSHWSGGGGDDLDNVALVNGSDCINTMENKDWSTYLKMAKNGYNSSDDDNNINNNGNDDSNEDSNENDEDLSLCDDNVNSKKITSNSYSPNRIPNNQTHNIKSSINTKSNSKIVNQKSSSKSSINSRKNSDNSKATAVTSDQHLKSNVKNSKNQQNANKKLNKENHLDHHSEKTKRITSTSSNTDSNNKKIKKKISQDSFESNKIENDTTDGLKSNKRNSFSDEEFTNNTNSLHNTEQSKHLKMKSSSIDHENEYDEELEIDESDEELDEVDDEEEYDDDEEEDDDDDDEDEDDLDDDDIWTIKPKLYSYYEKQFKTMEPNLNGFITGSVAKPFFERSKLPLNELSKIWELSDVTKDGALSFAEFCTAMHLVVLRVRNFELPNELPEKLQPYAPLIDFNTDTTNNPINRNKTNEESILNISDSEDMVVGSPNQQSSRLVQGAPGESLVQFSLKPQIPNDIQIVHPVALRYNTNNQNHYQQNQASGSIPEPPPRHSRSSSLGTINNPQAPPNSGTANHQQPSTTSNQPVQVNSTVSNVPNNPSSVTIPNTVNTPKILQQQPVVPPRITSPPPVYHQPQTQNEHSQQQQQQQAHSSALLPPPPPPLPHHQLHHHQNRLHHHQQHYPTNQQFSNPLPTANTRAPPLPPANQSSDDITKNIEKLVDQMSALNVERLKKISESNQKQQAVAASSSTSSTNSIDVDALAFSIKTQTEQNQLLRRVFSELEKELRALTDNRIALEIKLDYLNTATQSTNPSIVTTGASLTATASSNASNSTKKQQATIPSTPIAPNSSAQQNVQSSNLSSSNANSNNLPISSNIQSTSSNSGLTPSTTKTVIHTKANI